MSFLSPGEHPKEDLAKELSGNLPRLIGWLPTAIKGTYRGVTRWRLARKTEYQVHVQPIDARIDVRASDRATVDFSLSVSNQSKRAVEADRLELSGMSVGGRNLQRNSDMIKVRGDVPRRTVSNLWFTVDVRGSEVADLVQGISKASNLWCSPQASVRIYGEILFLTGSERFRKPVNFQWDWATCRVTSVVAESIR